MVDKRKSATFAISLSEKDAGSSIRITLNHENTLDDINITVEKIKGFVEALRALG